MYMRRTVVLSASAALAVLLLGVAALLWAQQAQAQSVLEPPCTFDFCIDKTAAPSTVNVGDQITFTITERCVTGDECGNILPLVDELPSGLTFVSVDDSQPDYQCSASGNTLTCAENRFSSPTAPYTITIVATTTECGTFTNTASHGFTSPGSVTYTVEGCPPMLPTTKAQCKNGGWREFGYPNQGRCVSDVNRRNSQ